MKLSTSILLLSAATAQAFRPLRINYKELSEQTPLLLDQLKTVGLVSLSNVFDSLPDVDSCISSTSTSTTAEIELEDGTRRRTLATEKNSVLSHCDDSFRWVISQVVAEVSAKISSNGEGMTLAVPISSGDGKTYNSFTSLVEHGTELEHFHSYDTSTKRSDEEMSLEWHVDQGMMLFFIPGTYAGSNEPSKNFYVRLPDGCEEELILDGNDQLVLLVGDGMVNVGLGHFRPVPHALKLPVGTERRVWYGRMVLPPTDAVSPWGKTYGQIREDQREDYESGIGCSISSDSPSAPYRILNEATECQENELYCWHRCMNVTEFQVSENICADRGLDLACINPRRQLYVAGHGDFFPDCIDLATAENHTSYPQLSAFPQDESCAATYSDKVRAIQDDGSMYDFSKVMDEDEEGRVTFFWSVTADNKIKGNLVYHGLFGWIGFGFRNMEPDAPKNGMHGAPVIMGLPGGNYSAVTGLDLTMDATAEEYFIHPDGGKAAFRHWNEPLSLADDGSSTKTHSLEVTECYVSLMFETDGILESKFNVSGTDELMWAVNDRDSFVGYHSARGIFKVHWESGQALTKDELDEGQTFKKVEEEDINGKKAGGTSSTSSAMGSNLVVFPAIVTWVSAAFTMMAM